MTCVKVANALFGQVVLVQLKRYSKVLINLT